MSREETITVRASSTNWHQLGLRSLGLERAGNKALGSSSGLYSRLTASLAGWKAGLDGRLGWMEGWAGWKAGLDGSLVRARLGW